MKKYKMNKNELNEFISRLAIKELNESGYRVIGQEKLQESINPDPNYTHFALLKDTNEIVNGWDYHGYDTKELSSDKNYYFYDDLRDLEEDPSKCKIWSLRKCQQSGIDPFDNSNWSNIVECSCKKNKCCNGKMNEDMYDDEWLSNNEDTSAVYPNDWAEEFENYKLEHKLSDELQFDPQTSQLIFNDETMTVDLMSSVEDNLIDFQNQIQSSGTSEY